MDTDTGIDIDLAGRDDIAALKSLAARGESAFDPGYFEQCLTRQGKKRLFIFAAKLKNKLCGFGILNLDPKYALYRRLGIPAVQHLYTDPAYRRKGVASRLIRHCEQRARQDGFEALGISVGLTSSFGAAQRLYVKLGYMPDGHGITYDRKLVSPGEVRPVDRDLCLMMIKRFPETGICE